MRWLPNEEVEAKIGKVKVTSLLKSKYTTYNTTLKRGKIEPAEHSRSWSAHQAKKNPQNQFKISGSTAQEQIANSYNYTNINQQNTINSKKKTRLDFLCWFGLHSLKLRCRSLYLLLGRHSLCENVKVFSMFSFWQSADRSEIQS